MQGIFKIDVQKTLDKIITKLFLWFIPDTVTPNQVTVVRFILVPLVYWLLVSQNHVLGLIVFVIAASTDFIDGAMARTRGQITDLGKMLDPIADKLLIMSVFLFIGFEYLIVQVFVVFTLFEIVAVLAGYFLAFAVGKPMGSNVFGKIKLVLQSLSIGSFLIGILVSSQFFIKLSEYILLVALFFAVMAGVEVARTKLMYVKKHTTVLDIKKTVK